MMEYPRPGNASKTRARWLPKHRFIAAVVVVASSLTAPAVLQWLPGLQHASASSFYCPGNVTTISQLQVGECAYNVGFRGTGSTSNLVVAIAIAWAESTDNCAAYNPSGATGLFQILGSSVSNLTSCASNSYAAWLKYTGAGNSFSPWATFCGFGCGSYTQDLSAAETAANQVYANLSVTISGHVSFGLGNAGGIGIYTCTGINPSTDGNGNFSFSVPIGTAFCIRAIGGTYPASWPGPLTGSNGSPSYEFQTASATTGGYNLYFGDYRSVSTGVGGGVTSLDGWGGLHSSQGQGYGWPGWEIARAITTNPNGDGEGYLLDGWGGIHPFGGAPSVAGSAYWSGWDIARDIKVLDWTRHSGYVLDGWGGIHPFNGAPNASGYAYWSGWDIARKIVINAQGTGGYTLDGWGGIHPFAIGSNAQPPSASGFAYWSGWDIARSIQLNPNGKGGYTLDGWGGIHPFALGGNPVPPATVGAGYWSGWDICRDFVVTSWNSDGSGNGTQLDGYGGLHNFAGQ